MLFDGFGSTRMTKFNLGSTENPYFEKFGGPSERTYNAGKLKGTDAHAGERPWQPRKSWPGGTSGRCDIHGCGAMGLGRGPAFENLFFIATLRLKRAHTPVHILRLWRQTQVRFSDRFQPD